jgi:hypothetical protein
LTPGGVSSFAAIYLYLHHNGTDYRFSFFLPGVIYLSVIDSDNRSVTEIIMDIKVFSVHVTLVQNLNIKL